MVDEVAIVIIDFEQELLALRDDHAEVMLAIRVVVGVEVVIAAQRLDDLLLDFLPKRRDPLA